MKNTTDRLIKNPAALHMIETDDDSGFQDDFFSNAVEKEGAKERWSVYTEYSRAEFIYDHGLIPENHPLQNYVNELSLRIAQKPNFPLRVYVANSWNEINATSLGDGTIFISIPLIKFAGNEEALLGVIAHEYAHIYREHTKKNFQGKAKGGTLSDTFISRISISRLHEYEADMRGTLIDLDKAGVNPIGFKDLLERIHGQEIRGPISVSHGSGTDRMLNIGTMFGLVDFRAISSSLSPIPQNILSSADTLPDGPTPLAPKIKETDLPIALSRKWKEMKRFIHPSAGELMSLVDSFSDACVPKEINDVERAMLTLFSLEYGAGVPVLNTREKRLGEIRKKYSKQLFCLNNPEQFERAYDAIKEQYPKLPFSRNLGSPLFLVQDLMRIVLERGTFGTFAGRTIRIDELKIFLDKWSALIAEFSRERDFEPCSQDDVFRAGAEIVVRALQKKDTETTQKAIELFLLEREETTFKDAFRAAGKRLALIDTINEFDKAVTREANALIPQISGLSFFDATKLINELLTGFDHVIYEKLYSKYRSSEYCEDDIRNSNGYQQTLDVLNQIRRPLIIAIFFKILLKTHPHAQKMTQTEQSACTIAIYERRQLITAYQAFLTEYYDEEAGESVKNEDNIEKIASRLAVSISLDPDTEKYYKNIIEKEMRMMEATLDVTRIAKQISLTDPADIKICYQYIVDDEFYGARIGLLEYEASHLTDVLRRNYFVDNFLIPFLLRQETIAEFFNSLDGLDKIDVPASHLLRVSPERCGALVLEICKLYAPKKQFPLPIARALSASSWISNVFLRARFQRLALKDIFPTLSFEEKLELLFPEKETSDIIDQKMQEQFIEGLATRAEFDSFRSRIERTIDDVISEGSANHGVGIIVESMDFTIKYNALSFLARLLRSGESDKDLKMQVYREVSVERYKEKQRIGSSNTDSVGLIKQRIHAADSILRTIFSLNTIGRHLLLRTLLCEQGQVLIHKEKKREFFDYLFSDFVQSEKSESDIENILLTVKGALHESDEWELLYYALSAILEPYIACSPARPTPWEKIENVVMDMLEQNVDEDDIGRVIRGELWDNVPDKAQSEPQRYWNEYRTYAEKELERILKDTLLSERIEHGKMSPLQFVKEVGAHIGALGVRFLQLLPQFAAIPEKYALEFVDVYDSVKGQSKLAAVHVLEREWPDMWNTVARIGERIGGGSVATVFRMEDKDGNRRVIKVRNPNLLYRLETAHGFIKEIVDIITKNNQHQSYAIVVPMLDDIRKWIESDVNFSGFLDDDERFRKKHDGFKPVKFSYAIKIPQSYGPASKYFAIEEEVDGKNLTKWDELVSDGQDMKQITALIAKNYFSQITSGMIHSDVHIGNFRVTSDKRVAVLDRNFFLKLSKQEQQMLQNFFNPLISLKKKKDTLFAYLAPKGGTLSQEQNRAVDELVDCIASQKFDVVRDSLISLRNSGIALPLTITLLLKNFNSLQQMTKKAGFDKLIDAYFYTPKAV